MTDNPITLTMSFNEILSGNPLPFSICLKSYDEEVNQTNKPSSALTQSNLPAGPTSPCDSITKSLDKLVQVFLCACEEAQAEMENTFDSVRNERNTKESLEKIREISLKSSKNITAKLDEATEKILELFMATALESYMTIPEKDYVVEYIRQTSVFFNQLWDWVAKMNQDILHKFLQGHSGEEKAASLLFQTVIQILENSDIHNIISANCKLKCPSPSSHGILGPLSRFFNKLGLGLYLIHSKLKR